MMTRRSALASLAALPIALLPTRAFLPRITVGPTSYPVGTFTSDAIQAALNQAIAAGGGTVYLPQGAYQFSGTVTAQQCANLKVVTDTIEGELHATTFVWNGPTGGTVLFLNNIRDSSFGGFSILNGTSAFGVGVDIDKTIQQNGAQNTTNLHFHDFAIVPSASGTAVRLSNVSPANCDLMSFERFAINGGQYAFLMPSYESKLIRLTKGLISGAQYGWFGRAAATLDTVDFENNLATDIYFTDINDAFTIQNCVSEGAPQFLGTAGPTSAAMPILIQGSRLDPVNCRADGKYIQLKQAGPLTLDAVDFASGSHRDNWLIDVSASFGNQRAVNARGCIFPNALPFGADPNYTKLVDGCLYVDATKGNQPLPTIETSINPPVVKVASGGYAVKPTDRVVIGAGGYVVGLPNTLPPDGWTITIKRIDLRQSVQIAIGKSQGIELNGIVSTANRLLNSPGAALTLTMQGGVYYATNVVGTVA